ncbi:MAG: hypothetical protein ACYCQI_08800 [Gammaproteobacteria bacterium]
MSPRAKAFYSDLFRASIVGFLDEKSLVTTPLFLLYLVKEYDVRHHILR